MTTAEWKPLGLQGAHAKGYITDARYDAIKNREVPGITGRRKVVNVETASKHALWAKAVEDAWIGPFNDQGFDDEREYMLREAITDAMQPTGRDDGGLQSVADAPIRHMMETQPAPLDCVIGGFLMGTVGMLTSPGATGKSFFSLELGVDIASGANILGLEPKVGGVTYLALEDDIPVLHHRLYDIGKHIAPEYREALYRNLHLMPCVGTRIDVESEADFIIDRCRGQRLIIIDTLSRAHAYEENSNSEMSRLMVTPEHIAKETGAAVMFLHHVAKGATGSSQHAARGASAITDNARWAGFIEKLSADDADAYQVNGRPLKPDDAWRYVRFNGSKVNHGAPNAPDHWYERASDTGVLIPAIGFKAAPTERRDGQSDSKKDGSKNTKGGVGKGGKNESPPPKRYDYAAFAEEGVCRELREMEDYGEDF
ncbi:helicase RepA family protein [Acidithiobacillus ferrianus]|uniref:helicase RepA family protein n=1 Tax=Acidithiobacillus ferrianus TaxID=2678518 RepID=UPI0034E45068